MAIEHLEHGADLSLRITGATAEEVLCEAAQGLFASMLNVDAVELREAYATCLEAPSHADLLVEWLSDLLAQKELSGLVFASFAASIHQAGARLVLDAVAFGERLDPNKHSSRIEVKGISYLGLEFRRVVSGWTARFVVDV